MGMVFAFIWERPAGRGGWLREVFFLGRRFSGVGPSR